MPIFFATKNTQKINIFHIFTKLTAQTIDHSYTHCLKLSIKTNPFPAKNHGSESDTKML